MSSSRHAAEGILRLTLSSSFDPTGGGLISGTAVAAGSGLGSGSGYGYYKLGRRKAMAISVVSAAVVLRMSNGRCEGAAISLGAVAPVPIRISAAEGLLTGSGPPEESVIEECGRLASVAATTIDDIRASAEYRTLMCEVLTKRRIRRASGQEA